MKKKKIYAIIDIETTGGRPNRDKITEIAIVLHDGIQIIDKFESLINPERTIPPHITRITGITDEMVVDAPKFYEVARKVVEMTNDAVFVAHNVRFDYNFIREEFRRLGFAYTRKQLCTVRLSRKAMPGLGSYSLGNLIHHFGIQVNGRHRAMADTLATVEVFEKILALENVEEQMMDMVNLGIKESKLPSNINLETLHNLPEDCGVYYFHDLNGDVVYVGKSINIKKRVMQHFAKQTEKANKLQKRVHEITYELTGSELIALLHESYEIKRLNPQINRAQRSKQFPWIVFSYYDEKGYRCFDIARNSNRARKTLNIITEYPKVHSARGSLKRIAENFQLCLRYLNMDPGTGPCFRYHLDQCYGACIGTENTEVYNARAAEAADTLSTHMDGSFFILEGGRTTEEKAVVLIEKGDYRGFGYIDAAHQQYTLEDLKDAIKPYPTNPETMRIIRRFLESKNEAQLLPF